MESGKNCDSMGLIAHLSEDKIIFERVEFLTENILKEKWRINFPLIAENFLYTFEKRNKKKIPIFPKEDIKIKKNIINNLNNTYIIFNAANHVDYVTIFPFPWIFLISRFLQSERFRFQ